jgi:hypothetical protein
LPVNTNTIAQNLIAFQLFKLVACGNAEIIEIDGAIKLAEFPPRDTLNVRRQFAAAPTIPDGFRFGIGE